jgi:SAM-dependent methyltransferase
VNAHQETNRRRWNELAALHVGTEFYDLERFKRGASSLRSIEVAELGDVTGKSLLHLQCHFGQDTLSWARRGARVTGVDFSETAIDIARGLARDLNLQAEFVCSRVEDLPQVHTGTFDIVFTSYGAVCWLPDLAAWARTIAHFLVPGSVFYMVEIHPFAELFEEEASTLQVRYPYFGGSEPLTFSEQSSYADRTARVTNTTEHVWNHSLGAILTSLVNAGLRIEFVHEFPCCVYPKFAGMTQDADGWWRLPPAWPAIPLLFSVKASNLL